MNTRALCILLLIGALAHIPWAPSVAAGFTDFTAPNALGTVEGNSAASFPFSGATASMRYQQVFEASQFSPVANGGGLITYIAFRMDGGCGGGESATSQSFQ